MKARPDISLVGPPRAAAPVKKFSAVMGFLMLALAAVAQQNPNSIIYSKHNLSVSGPGTLRSATEREVCIFCHAPHNATGDGPLGTTPCPPPATRLIAAPRSRPSSASRPARRSFA